MKIKRKNRKLIATEQEVVNMLTPQFRNLMFEKRIHRGILAAKKTQKRLSIQKISKFLFFAPN